MITYNFTTLTTNPQTLTNIPDYNQIHEVMVVDHFSGEILCTIQYNWIKWSSVQTIFEKYQKTHKPFDIYWDKTQKFQLFRIYQQKQNGVWVKRPYTPGSFESAEFLNDEIMKIKNEVEELKEEIKEGLNHLENLKKIAPQYIKGTPEYESRIKGVKI